VIFSYYLHASATCLLLSDFFKLSIVQLNRSSKFAILTPLLCLNFYVMSSEVAADYRNLLPIFKMVIVLMSPSATVNAHQTLTKSL